MPTPKQPLADFLQGKQRILVTTHARPDGDALGSCTAMAELLEKLGKKPEIITPTPYSPKYDFMCTNRPVKAFEKDKASGNWDGLMVLDTGTWNQLAEMGDWIKKQSFPICVLDHHVTQDNLGYPLMVDTNAEATGRLVYECFEHFSVTPSAFAANQIFVALATDTGWFRHANTTTDSLALAARLVALGAQTTSNYDLLFDSNSFSRQRLIGTVLERISSRQNGKVVFSWLSLKDFEKNQAKFPDAEDVIMYLRGTKGAEIIVFFLEVNENTTRVNFRSRNNLNVCQIAQSFGGGGHKLAAGASVEMKLENAMEKVLKACEGTILSTKIEVKNA